MPASVYHIISVSVYHIISVSVYHIISVSVYHIMPASVYLAVPTPRSVELYQSRFLAEHVSVEILNSESDNV